MKYFFWDKWDEPLFEDGDAKAYNAYLDSIHSALPKGLRTLTSRDENVWLSDSEIQKIELSIQEQQLELHLDGRWIEGTVVGLRTFRLQYKGVSKMTSSVTPDLQGLFSGGYGTHGFDEVEILKDGSFEHRMLFSSGIEIAIQFRDFVLDYTDFHN